MLDNAYWWVSGKTTSLVIQTNLSPEMVYPGNCHHVGKTKVSTDTMSMNVCFIFISRWGDMLGPDASLEVKVRLSRISRKYNTLGESISISLIPINYPLRKLTAGKFAFG